MNIFVRVLLFYVQYKMIIRGIYLLELFVENAPQPAKKTPILIQSAWIQISMHLITVLIWVHVVRLAHESVTLTCHHTLS